MQYLTQMRLILNIFIFYYAEKVSSSNTVNIIVNNDTYFKKINCYDTLKLNVN